MALFEFVLLTGWQFLLVPLTAWQIPSSQLASSVFAQPADGVTVTTDSSSYAVGDPIQVTITYAGPDRISRGGLDCDDVWPLALEQLDADGNWQPAAVPQHQCIGIAAVLVGPGETQMRTISLTLDLGTYRLVYTFTDVDAGTQQTSISDPFDVSPPSPSAASSNESRHVTPCVTLLLLGPARSAAPPGP